MDHSTDLTLLSFIDRWKLVFGKYKVWIYAENNGEEMTTKFFLSSDPPFGTIPLGYIKPRWNLGFLFTANIKANECHK